MRAVRVPTMRVQRDVHMLVRSFPSRVVHVYRRSAQPTSVDEYGQSSYSTTTQFKGEALFSEAGGSTTRYGLGQVEEEKPLLIMPGKHEVAAGDLFEIDGRKYRVEFAPTYWPGFTVATAVLAEQGTSTSEAP